MKFEKLFEPIKIGNLSVKNKIAMAPMHAKGMVDTIGNYTPRAIDYYVERAVGGIGLIITGAALTTKLDSLNTQPFVSPETIASFNELAESVHYYGAKIIIQLSAGFGRVRFLPQTGTVPHPVSASAVPSYWRPDIMARALTTEEVEDIVDSLGRAAELLRAAGIDGVELHGHEGYLLDQFTTALWNERNDKYGGNLKSRLTFPVEILQVIKKKAGKDFPVIYQYGLKHYMKAPWSGALEHETNYKEAGRDIGEGLEMARLLEKAGYDALHIDAGSYDSWYWAHPPTYQSHGCMVDLAARVKEAVSIPVIAAGRLDLPDLAEEALRVGKADIIALGRALLADPYWPKKVHDEKLEEIRPCTGCQDGCMYRYINEGKPMSCSVNPAVLRERTYSIRKVDKPTKVIIVGGGVAGMEAARVSALKSCQTILFEKTERLGGHLIAASVPDFKQDYRRLLDWYTTQLRSLNVEIRLKTEATAELIINERPGKVILATGSVAVIPNVPGIERQKVVTCIDLLLGKFKAGDSVCVVGGGLMGCETALWLADQGKKVIIIEALPELCPGVFHANRVMLLDLLKDKGVEHLLNTHLTAVSQDGIQTGGVNLTKKHIPCDTVALAMGLQPNEQLYLALQPHVTELYLAGDCREPHNVMYAIWDGYHVASC